MTQWSSCCQTSAQYQLGSQYRSYSIQHDHDKGGGKPVTACDVHAEAQGQAPQLSPAVLAAAVRCLAAAPRLPPLDWGTPLHQLLRTTSSETAVGRPPQPATQAAPPPFDPDQGQSSSQEPSSGAGFPAPAASDAPQALSAPRSSAAHAGSRLGAACVLLALKHASAPSHGLGSFINTLMSQERFAQLPAQLQQMLLTGLPEVLESLPSQRSVAVLDTLHALTPNSSQSPATSSLNSIDLSTAAWTGLARFLHNTSVEISSAPGSQAAHVVQAALAATQQLMHKLPVVPFLLPGEQLPVPALDLDAALAAVDAARASARQPDRDLGQGLLRRAWGAALMALQALPRSQVSLHCLHPLLLTFDS